MRQTFKSDDSMVITIPIRSLRDAREGQLLPEKFYCVFKDTYKVFVVRGKPKPLGAAQATAGVFVLSLGLTVSQANPIILFYTMPSFLFVVSGMVSYAAGHCPNMHVAKLSLSLNIISFFWAVAAFCLSALSIGTLHGVKLLNGVSGMIAALLLVEMMIALALIFWLSKAICRQHFNTLPTILLKQEVGT
ncbi:membrane-spanning 4-domains subfamily A member 4A [Myripristis murdjan]|uniref:membrane-spanning 4-domains subfamily A member 4A n=1 Tax=Myripristis murdjan TaxID=586833 RepID=UPI00117648C1|nr:membrane-spanning 4-domains subfamily A member 4A-like [Myripristis murdjan]